MSKDIWVYAETHDGKLCDIVPELLTKGRQLKAHNGGDLVAVVLGSADDAALRELSEYGADMVIIGENAALSSYSARTYAQAMTALAKKYEPEIFIIPATGVGREVAPLTMQALDTGLTADALDSFTMRTATLSKSPRASAETSWHTSASVKSARRWSPSAQRSLTHSPSALTRPTSSVRRSSVQSIPHTSF